jgi:hypothetical protein
MIGILRRNSLLEWRRRFMEHLSQQKIDGQHKVDADED